MSWIETFSLVMRSNITSLREKVENPERMLHQLVCDMEEELEAVRHSVAAAMADELQLGRQVDEAREKMKTWIARAEAALRRGDESTARQALEQKLRSEESLSDLEETYASQRSQTEKLRTSYHHLEDKIQQARRRKTLLVARLARAEAACTINTALERAEGTSAFAEFSRLERKVERSEAMCSAYDRLAGRESDADALAAQFSEEEHREILEAEFDALKRRMGSGPL